MYNPRMRLRPLTPTDSQARRRACMGRIWHVESVRTEGRRVGAYSQVRAVMAAMAEGTLPLKRLDPRSLCNRAVAR